ncbi:MAG: CYTH domain-containing protein [Planctomycetia bacterium]|nr:CYTH domain-containing protein [Planctomycetia bacterium]NCG13284.1 CYTH domain-containing protein [Planctomycetia bacterium]
MKSSSEVELKLLLPDEAALLQLCSILPGYIDTLQQTNIYFDVNGMIKESGAILRLRLCENEAELTLKIRGSLIEGVSNALEYSDILEEEWVSSLILREENSALSRLGTVKALHDHCGCELAQLTEWGRSSNERRRYQVEDDLMIEVDKTSFPGNILRCEVEVECDDTERARKYLSRQFQELNIPIVNCDESKSAMLFRLLEAEAHGDPEEV